MEIEAYTIKVPVLRLSNERWSLCWVFFIQAAVFLTKLEDTLAEQPFSAEGNFICADL